MSCHGGENGELFGMERRGTGRMLSPRPNGLEVEVETEGMKERVFVLSYHTSVTKDDVANSV